MQIGKSRTYEEL